MNGVQQYEVLLKRMDKEYKYSDFIRTRQIIEEERRDIQTLISTKNMDKVIEQMVARYFEEYEITCTDFFIICIFEYDWDNDSFSLCEVRHGE